MKLILSLAFFMTCANLFGQNDYQYVYKLNPEAELIITDTLTVRRLDSSRIKLTILDENESPIAFCKAKFQNSDTTLNKLIDEYGMVFLTVPAGNWNIQINSPEFSDFNTNIKINKTEELQLTIHLIKLESMVTIYSMDELNQHELNAIKYCIVKSKKPNECFGKEYKIVIEI